MNRLRKQAQSNMAEHTEATPKNYLIIDGGATKTIAVITDQDGKILGKARAGASNYQNVGEQATFQVLKEAILGAVNDFQQSVSSDKRFDRLVLRRAVFAIAGIDTAEDKEKMREIVHQVVQECSIQMQDVIVENDALAALLGATRNAPGAILISGTGSICYAHDGKGNFHRVGGWGHIVGDEGSGYWIGKEALTKVLQMADGRERKTALYDLVLEDLRVEHYEALYNWIHTPDYKVERVAKLATVVEKARLMGDPVSLNIIEQAIAELFLLVKTALEKTGVKNERCKIVLLGGVLEHNDFIRKRVTEKIQSEFADVEIIEGINNPFELIIQRAVN